MEHMPIDHASELKKPAAIKIIASSLQLLSEFTGWESWANFPNDQNRPSRSSFKSL